MKLKRNVGQQRMIKFQVSQAWLHFLISFFLMNLQARLTSHVGASTSGARALSTATRMANLPSARTRLSTRAAASSSPPASDLITFAEVQDIAATRCAIFPAPPAPRLCSSPHLFKLPQRHFHLPKHTGPWIPHRVPRWQRIWAHFGGHFWISNPASSADAL